MRSWRILAIGPTDILLHPAVIPCAVYALLTGHGALWFTSCAVVLVHESAHALTAAIFRNPPSAMEFTPLGAVMRLEDEDRLEFLPRMLMLLAGPASSLVLAWLSLRLTSSCALSGVLGKLMFFSSLSIVLVNLLPVAPLDGGRLLNLLISRIFSDAAAAKTMQVLGSMIGASLIVLNVFVSFKWGGWNLSLACAGCCILYGTAAVQTTAVLHELQAMMERKIHLERRRILPGRLYCVMGNTGLRKALRFGRGQRQIFYCVIQPGTMTVQGWLYELNAITIYLDHPEITVAEALSFVPKQPGIRQK